MEIKANAKINLCLDVIRRKENGYHELKMIIVPLVLHDLLQVEFNSKDELSSNDQKMPVHEQNSIFKALKIMRETYQIKEHFKIYVDKQIPMEAGLAGGSADAAAMIHAVDQLCQLGLSLEEKINIGKQVGADVPFCLVNEPSVVSGIGEQVQPFKMISDCHILLVKPKEGVSTKEAYQTLDFQTCPHPNCNVVKQALETNDFKKLCENVGNSLESSAFVLVPQVKILKEELITYGFDGVLMSGSGSTLFALTKNETLLKEGYHHFKERYAFVEMTKIWIK